MGTRHDSIGVKQVIPYEWIQKTARFMLAGVSAKEIRQELHAALAATGKQVQPGERSAWTRTFLVNNLMSIWPSPPADLTPFRNKALHALGDQPAQGVAIHWAMISAVYPFWFNHRAADGASTQSSSPSHPGANREPVEGAIWRPPDGESVYPFCGPFVCRLGRP